MKIDRNHKPELCVSKDPTRFHLTYLYLDTEAKRLVSTDGHRLVSVPVTLDPHDTSGPVTVEAIAAARKATPKLDPEIVCNGAQVIKGAKLDRPTEEQAGKFPPYQQVIPSARPGTEGTLTIALNAEYLAQLAKAIGAGPSGIRITITLPKPGEPMMDPLVLTAPYGDAVGILMPCRL